MTYRSDLDALAARHAALEAELADKTRERDASERLLTEARARARLPVLDNIRIASPCKADWAAMQGDDRVRACATCDKQVFNLSAMTRDEAEALITERAGNLCARYYQRADGTILLSDCTIGVQRRRRQRVLAAGALALLGGSALAYKLMHRPDVVARAAQTQDVLPPPAVALHVSATSHEAPPPMPVMGQVMSERPAPVMPKMGKIEMRPQAIGDEP